ncbi:unnamed protein product [Caenorhabditis angaria]|uniref:Uncharacterized protein n=1 Tax=Caenorhabditis angaria TaxID=860376 RepID=A0A9P1J232_9PELO|nr:unnamed protein product [Caenorhabditis angaria]
MESSRKCKKPRKKVRKIQRTLTCKVCNFNSVPSCMRKCPICLEAWHISCAPTKTISCLLVCNDCGTLHDNQMKQIQRPRLNAIQQENRIRPNKLAPQNVPDVRFTRSRSRQMVVLQQKQKPLARKRRTRKRS